ncbi:MAG: hypothetical protein E3K32_07630 [wastewater metagenome]|nr:hypothetical protein [Candidatus Loosdrechtia aerotolerans]
MIHTYRKQKDRKVVIIGLDGVPYTLLVNYISRGLMPQFSELCKNGKLLRMNSSLPEISSVAWSSFMTGKNPGQHGIFGFMEIDRQSYEYRFPNFTSLKERPFWEKENIQTVALNIPQTYPAMPIHGVMVSGFVALDLKKATYPERIFDYLNKINYKIDVDSKKAVEDPEAFFIDLFETFSKRKQAMEYLYDNEEWQLFIGTITETDRLHHFFFDSAEEGKYFHVFERFYTELDDFIGTMARKAAKDNAVFLTCSDHGFTSIKTEVYLNKWLIENGYLSLNDRKKLSTLVNNSKAFCLDPSRIYINLEGKYGKGSVKNSDYEALLSELKEKLYEIQFEGQNIINKIYFNREIFQGMYASMGPDLYLLPNYGFDLKGSVSADTLFGIKHFKGMHTYDDAHLFVSYLLQTENISIEHIAEIIAGHFK